MDSSEANPNKFLGEDRIWSACYKARWENINSHLIKTLWKSSGVTRGTQNFECKLYTGLDEATVYRILQMTVLQLLYLPNYKMA